MENLLLRYLVKLAAFMHESLALNREPRIQHLERLELRGCTMLVVGDNDSYFKRSVIVNDILLDGQQEFVIGLLIDNEPWTLRLTRD